MATLKNIIAETGQVLTAPSQNEDIVRLLELTNAVSGLITAEQFDEAIEDATHAPASASESGLTVTVSVADGQIIGAEVRLLADSELQAAAVDQNYTQSIVASDTTVTLGKLKVSNVVVIRRLLSDQSLEETGVDGVDYFLDEDLGIITFSEESNLLNDDESPQVTEIYITFNCAQIQDGSGMLSSDGGLKDNFGNGHHQVSRGDHRHANDHRPVTGSEAAITTITTLDAYQSLKTEVKISGSIGGLSAEEDGLAVDFDAVAAKEHSHDVVTNLASGFMSPEMLAALTAAAAISAIDVDVTETIELVKTDGVITANAILGAGLDSDETGIIIDENVVALKSVTDDHQTRLTAAEGAIGSIASALSIDDGRISTLESSDVTQNTAIGLRPLTTYVDAADAALANAIGLKADQSALDALQDEVDDCYSPTNPVPDVTTEASGLMTSSELEDLQCLSLLLQKAQFAQKFLPKIRVESPNTGTPSGGVVACPLSIVARNIHADGLDSNVFTLKIQILGVAELKDVTGGAVVNGSGGRAVKNGTPASDAFNSWVLTIEDNGTGTDTYLLNTKIDSDADNAPVVLDYEIEVLIKGGSAVNLETDSSDSLQATHSLTVAGVPPYPEIFPGHFIQINPIELVGECSLSNLITGGISGGIYVDGTGRDGKDGIGIAGENGHDGLRGWNGTNGTDGSGVPSGTGDDSSDNEPVIDMARDLSRLSLMDGGGANGWIHTIRVNGDDVWIGGSFTRFGDHTAWGLARLGDETRYAYDFTRLAAGFSEPIRFLAITDTDGVFAASIHDGLFQNINSWPVHQVKRNGQLESGFTCPSQISTNDADHPDVVIGMDRLSNGRVAVLTPRTLTVLNDDGSVFSRNDSDNDMFLSVLAVGEKILLSSHAWSEPNIAQRYGALKKPRGLKLLVEGDASFDLDPIWDDSLTAGTGAMASCGVGVAGPENTYFIVGNALDRYNGIDTSWNAQLIGNMILWSEAFDEYSVWTQTGSIGIADGDNVPDITDDGQILSDTDGVSQAFISQSVTIDSGFVRPTFSIYVEKEISTASYPVIELKLEGGTTEVDAYAYLNTVTGAYNLINAYGAGSPTFTVESVGDWWRVSLALSNNNTGNDTATVNIFPAYSSAMSGTSTSVTGDITISGAQLRYDSWEPDYVLTTIDQELPPLTSTNADRFRGLYKILANGEADLDFSCALTFSGDEGMTIPFAIDHLERIYIGGPIASIRKEDLSFETVTPWMLYRLKANGAFDAAFQIFDDDVLAMKLTDCGDMIVGGKFTSYGAKRCGRIILLNVDGVPIEEQMENDDPVISSIIEPDVTLHPCFSEKLWYDTSSTPKVLKRWNDITLVWEPMTDTAGGGGGGTFTLPGVTFSPTNGAIDPSPSEVVLTCPGYPAAAIYYTTDGSTPTSADTLYGGAIPITTGTTVIKAFARLSGATDSSVTTASYLVTAKLPDVVFSPGSGTHTPTSVTLSCSGYGSATIYYTLDGSDPTVLSSVYSIPIDISEGPDDTVIKAFAILATYRDSDISSATYSSAEYDSGTLPDVVFNPIDGTDHPLPLLVTMTVPGHSDATIYYTTDGSDPDDTSAVYSGPVTLSSFTNPIKAFARAVHYDDSAISSASYTQRQVSAPEFDPMPDAGSAWTNQITSGTGMGTTGNYAKIACSADGSIIYATFDPAQASIRKSTDFGATWHGISLLAGLVDRVNVIECSADGNTVVVGMSGSGADQQIVVSVNGGSTWTTAAVGFNGINATSFRIISGSRFIASIGPRSISDTRTAYTIGFDAVIINGYTQFATRKISASLDGSKVLWIQSGTGGFGSLWTSVTGLEHPALMITDSFSDGVVSRDGSTWFATKYNGNIYKSTDGSTWDALPSAGSRAWERICCSDDGMIIGAVVSGGDVYISFDGGSSWTAQGLPVCTQPRDIVVSSDGLRFTTTNRDPADPTYRRNRIYTYHPSFEYGTAVTLSDADAPVDMYFTVDGSDPDTSSTHYTSPVIIPSPLTLKAIAVKAGYIDSEITEVNY